MFSASKENFLRLKKMILVGGKDDGVITPWQSRYTEDSHISYMYAHFAAIFLSLVMTHLQWFQ